MIFARYDWVFVVALFGMVLPCSIALAERGAEGNTSNGTRVSQPFSSEESRNRQTVKANIHWQGVSYREAISRLKSLFKEPILIDRRVNPETRVSLDIAADSTEQVLNAVGSDRDYQAVHIGKLVYFGPTATADHVRDLIAQHTHDVAHLPPALRSSLVRKQSIGWERLSEPRQVITDLVRKNGWRVTGEDRIPLDLWEANELPDLTMIEALTVMLIGFNVSWEIEPQNRTLTITPLAPTTTAPAQQESPIPTAARKKTPTKSRPDTGTKQVYTLHVQEKPVGAVLRELAGRLNWSLHIDEKAIQAKGKSLDQRVSCSVDNADRKKLLMALLTPAGLDFRIEGNDVYVFPQRYENN